MAGVVPQRRSGVPAAQLTDDQLKHLAGHVTYVVETFAYAVAQAIRLDGPAGEPSEPEERRRALNVHLEVAVEFARALDDFLSARGTKPDDLFAVHYLSTWTIPAVLAGDLRDTINKQGPHLSTARLNKQGFDMIGIANVISSLALTV